MGRLTVKSFQGGLSIGRCEGISTRPFECLARRKKNLRSVRLPGSFSRGAGGLFVFLFAALISVAPVSMAWAGTVASQSAPIRILVLKTEEEAQAAVKDLNDGFPFERLARDRSIGPERERGGYLGRVELSGLSPSARAALAKTAPGRISPIFPTEKGFAVIQVLTREEEQKLEERIRREPEARELLERGTTLGQAGDLEAAETALKQATELNPELVDAHYNLAIVYRRRQKLDAAITTMTRVTQLRPDDYEAHMRLGTWRFEQGQYGEACVAFERAALLRMDSREAWLRLAQSYAVAGRPRDAVGAFRRAQTRRHAATRSWLRIPLPWRAIGPSSPSRALPAQRSWRSFRRARSSCG